MDSIQNKNALEMYIHPDGYYRCEKVSSLHMSWLLFKRIFKLVFNGFARPDGKKLEGTVIEKILAVGYVLFALLGCLALLIALGVLADAGIGPLFFIFLGIGASLLGIVVIGTIVSSAIYKKNMYEDKICFYLNTENKILAVNEKYKLFFADTNKYRPCNMTDYKIENLIIPRSQVYDQKDWQHDCRDSNRQN